MLHAARGIEEGKEEAYHQQGVDSCAIEQQAGQGGNLGYHNVVVDGKCHKGETDKDDVVGGHAAPVDGDALLQSATEEEIGLPEDGDEEDADDFAKQNADDAEEGSQAEGDGEV